jgi:hypothetical protein
MDQNGFKVIYNGACNLQVLAMFARIVCGCPPGARLSQDRVYLSERAWVDTEEVLRAQGWPIDMFGKPFEKGAGPAHSLEVVQGRFGLVHGYNAEERYGGFGFAFRSGGYILNAVPGRGGRWRLELGQETDGALDTTSELLVLMRWLGVQWESA